MKNIIHNNDLMGNQSCSRKVINGKSRFYHSFWHKEEPGEAAWPTTVKKRSPLSSLKSYYNLFTLVLLKLLQFCFFSSEITLFSSISSDFMRVHFNDSY